MTAEQIARELGGATKTAGGFVCRCPAHDDRNPSLSITERRGKLLVRCFAGCEQAAVVAALKGQGLWPEAENHKQSSGPTGVVVATYPYTDEDGHLLYEVCRFEPKDFRPRRPDGMWGYGPRRVLYHLREVLEAPIVFVVEGEKDVETLRDWGFVATTNPGGANGWRPEFNEFLRGREVILIPDNDPPGRKRVAQIGRQLLGVASRLRILQLPGAKDPTEWFTQGHCETEFLVRLEGEYVA